MKPKPRKAQGSVEFLMTYSWALVIILIAIVVAWRWGLFNLSSNVEPGSYGFWGVTPMDYKMSTGGQLTLSLHNEVGVNVTLNSVRVITGSANQTVNDGTTVIEAGKKHVLSVPNLAAGRQGERFDIFVIINYTNSKMQANRERLSSGTIWGPYE